jgi:Ca-activated chloride channel homolog
MTWALQPPEWWPMVLFLPVALMLASWATRRFERRLLDDLGPREAVLCGARRFARVRAVLATVAAGAIGLALLRPVTPGKEAQMAPDVVLCVDVSRSMAAGDGDPTRFDALRSQAHALLEQGVGSRFALLAFAGDVQSVAPLTADREAVACLLDELAPGAIGFASAAGGTNLGKAIAAAATSLSRLDTVGELLLLTDGEDFAGAAEQAAEAAAAEGHRVHCVGYGSASGSKVVVERDGKQGYLHDNTGQDVITRLDVQGLEDVAVQGGGSFSLGQGREALVDLWSDELVPFAAQRRLRASDADVVQRYSWALLVGLLLLMLRMCLPERTR